jgi:hypothetical protein
MVTMVQVRMFDLSIENDQLLTKQGILCNQFGFAAYLRGIRKLLILWPVWSIFSDKSESIPRRNARK